MTVAAAADSTTADTGSTQTAGDTATPQTAEQDILSGEPAKAQVDATAQQGTTPDTQAADIEIKVPDGVQVDEDLMGKFKPLAKEIGLDSAKAQKMLDLYIEAQNGYSSKIDAAWNETKEGWRETVKKDPEIGGAKFNETVGIARKAIEKFGGPGLKQALNDLGIGNHPEIVRFAYKVGKMISEDSVAGITGSPPKANDEEAKLRAAFPSMYK